MTGKLYIIGAGPGKADLMTVRGARILKQAEVVVYDYLVGPMILDGVSADTKRICTDRLVKKGRVRGRLDHSGISRTLIREFRAGKKVVRLKNGDPSVFGRFAQELEPLVRAQVPFEIVPGVTAGTAASCLTGIPFTDRRFTPSCVFITGHESSRKKKSSINWSAIARQGTIILFMAVENLSSIVDRLIAAGKEPSTPVAVIKDISRITQQTVTGTLADIVRTVRRQGIKPPAIIVIGEVVAAGRQLDWIRKSKKILFTGLSDERYFIDGIYTHLPMIRIIPAKKYAAFDRYLRRIREFDWIVFASRYGVEYFFQRLRAVGLDARALGMVRIAAIGRSTERKLGEYSLKADLVPARESAAGLIAAFAKQYLQGARVFLPRSDIGDKNLCAGLERLGAEVISAVAYRNVMPDDLPDLDVKGFDEVMFTSPSTVRNFKQRYGRLPKKVRVRCIGEATKKEARRCRLVH